MDRFGGVKMTETKVRIEHFDELMQLCGYCNDESPVCGGGLLGCGHPDNSDKETIDSVQYGQCYRWVCPITMELTPDDEEEDRERLDIVYDKDGWEERLEHYMLISEESK